MYVYACVRACVYIRMCVHASRPLCVCMRACVCVMYMYVGVLKKERKSQVGLSFACLTLRFVSSLVTNCLHGIGLQTYSPLSSLPYFPKLRIYYSQTRCNCFPLRKFMLRVIRQIYVFQFSKIIPSKDFIRFTVI
jgi:hypothetical protein